VKIDKLRDMLYAILKLDMELGVTPEAVLNEVYEMWKRKYITEEQFDDFIEFAEDIDKYKICSFQITYLKQTKELQTCQHYNTYNSYKRERKRKRIVFDEILGGEDS